MKTKIFLLFFFLVAALELTAVMLKLEWLIVLTKPLLMPALLMWAIAESGVQKNTLRVSIIVALIFSFLGDVLLLLDGSELYFLLGLGSFLVAQCAYIYTFIRDIRKPLPFSMSYLFAVIAFVVTYVIVFFYILLPSLGDMAVPVLIYAIAVGSMGLTAALRFKSVPDKSFYLVLVGAVLFIISDTSLGLDKFVFAGQHSFALFIIMPTYIGAQFLIVKGLITKG